jgi:hypothetical protein
MGIILLAAVTLLILLLPKEKVPERNMALPAIEPIKSLVEQCLYQTTKEAIFWNGKSGGYFTLPQESTANFYQNLPYYIYHNQSLIPNRGLLEKEMKDYVDAFFPFCLDFSSFEKQGYQMTPGKPNTTITLTATKILSQVKIPIKIQKGDLITELSEFQADLDDKQLPENIAGVQELLAGTYQKKFCLSCFADIGGKRNWRINFEDLGNSTYLFRIVDQDYLYKSESYQLNFVVNYG